MMSSSEEPMHYRHTQVGWVILGVTAVATVLVLTWLPAEAASAAAIPLLLTAVLVLLVFCSLTVEVDREAIRLRLGIGLLRKRMGLTDVSSWRAVRQPWYTGWGIRLGPGYVLWNVSGFDAVELALADGRRFRVGTDEPDALTSALTQAKGLAAVPAPPDEPKARPRARIGRGFVAALLLGIALVGWIFWSQIQPPTVTVGPTGFEVDTLFYGRSVPATDIVGIFLERSLPRVLWKSNGFAGAGTRRGRFQIEGLGEGQLYVEDGIAPYVVVRLRQGFVIVNFREPERTRALFEDMARAWPDRVHR
jgi:hypothetical protein